MIALWMQFMLSMQPFPVHFNSIDGPASLTIGTCLNELKIEGHTGNLANARSSSSHKIQLNLKDGTNLQGTLCHSTRNTPYLCTLFFKTGLKASSKCVKMEDIINVSLIANGNDGWYIASISAYVKTTYSQYMLLTKNDNFNKWLDGNQHYPYDAKKHALTFVTFCLNELKIQGRTGNLGNAGSSSQHKIQLGLKDGTNLQGTLCHFARNKPYLYTLSFPTGLNAGNKCVQMEDVQKVSLIANGNDGWYIASISAYVKTSSSQYMLLTKNDNFNKWLDGNQHYQKHVLTFVAFCLNELKIQGQTGNLVSAGSSSPHKIQLNLKDGTHFQVTLCHFTQNTTYLCTLFFKTGLNAGSKCVQMEDINQVSLIAKGNDGWYIASISAYVKTSSFRYMLLTKNDNFNKWLDGNQHYPYNAKKHVLTFVAFCLNELKIQGQTRNLVSAGSSSPHKIQLNLKDGTNLQGTLCHSTQNTLYLCTLFFKAGLNAGSKCVQMEDINQVSLIANGNDGWYIASISAYVKTSSFQYMLLTKNDNFNKWLDRNQHLIYPYNAKKHVLTFVAFCLNELKIQGQTGNLGNAESSSPHKIQLGLKDGTNLQGTLCHFARNKPYLYTLSFPTGLNAGNKCVQMEDVQKVSLIANGNDGWYIASISAYVKTSSSQYMLLTKNDNFNKWLDGNQHYPYNAKKHVLTFVAFCLIELKIQGQTRNLVSTGSSSPHKIQLNLKDGTNLQGTLCHSTQNTPYLCTLFFKTGLNAGSKCVQMEDINQVSLIANGNDGWYIASISAYVKTCSFRYMLLTKNDNFNKWLDGNQHYPYNAKKHVLTFVAFCLIELKIQGQTRNLVSAGSSSPHKIQLNLKDGTNLQGTLCHSTQNTPYLCTLFFKTGLNAGSKCVQMEDINQVSLIANGNDGWYIASISAYVKTSSFRYMLLTMNDNFNKWLDGNEHLIYPYNAKKHVLIFCLNELKIQGQTGNLGNAGSSSPHKIQLGLKNGTSLLGTLCHFARNKQYLYTLSFATGLNAGNKCVQMEDIQKVSLIANGNDGWYIASISIYVKTNNSQYRLLIKNENFHRWLDGNDHYPYDAKKHSLTFAAEIRIQAATLVATGNDEDDA